MTNQRIEAQDLDVAVLEEATGVAFDADQRKGSIHACHDYAGNVGI